jgi:plastocyanin
MNIRFSLGIVILVMSSLAAACSSSYDAPTSPSPSPTPGSSLAVAIVRAASSLTNAAFSPNPDTIGVGAALTWTNNDTTTHTTVSDDGSWASGNIAPGAAFTRTFSTAGTFTYHCAIHPNMVGTITVGP